MTKDEALKLALEFVSDIQRGKYKGDAEEVITAIKQALAAQPAPVPLTDEEIDAIRFSIPTKAVTQRDFELARAIEAKLKQKNAAAQPTPVREPEYWNVIDPAGNIVASETDAIRGWARIAGSYKPTVEGLLGFHDQGWRVLPKVTPFAQPAPVQEPWGACVFGRVFVGRLPEHARKFSEEQGVPIQWLYTTPPAAQRQWVGLSQDELDAMFSNTIKGKKLVNYVARAIEAKLKEKNT